MTHTATIDTTTRRPVDIVIEHEEPESDLLRARRIRDDDEFMREDEITCPSCHLIVNVRMMADPQRRICQDCAGPEVASKDGT